MAAESNRLSGVTVTDVVRKLIGPIEPQGESTGDARRYENLEAMTTLIHELLMDLSYVARSRNSYESSVQHAGKHAAKFLNTLTEEYGVGE